ncbi:secreted protein [gut metagenome]|uniref:Secreted protein n=1 Tax=gut metagenome TaxID=749906 RepID=J9GFZ8_9ZZZZ
MKIFSRCPSETSIASTAIFCFFLIAVTACLSASISVLPRRSVFSILRPRALILFSKLITRESI